MKEHNQNHKLIEYMLTLMDLLRTYHMEIDELAKEDGLERLLVRQDSQNLRMASEIAAFMDEMPGGFLIYRANKDEEILYANKGLLRIFQCGSIREFRELTRNSFRGIVYPEDLEEVEQSIKKQIADSQYDLDYVEYRIVRKDGVIRWIEDYGHFVHSEAVGDIFYVFLGDATEKRNRMLREKANLLYEKKQKEKTLQSLIEKYDKERTLIRQEHLRRLEVIEGLSVNYESILYADLDEDTVVPYRLSNRVDRQFGEKFQESQFSCYCVGYVERWVHPEDRELVSKATDPAYIREKLSDNGTYYINYRVLVDGETQYLQMRIVDVGHKKQGVQIVMGCRRVDEELQQEMEQKQMLAQALDNANLAIVAKNTFLSNMSHDMRTPLNAIFGFTALAKKNIGSEELARGYLERVEASSQQLLDLIDKLLELSWTGSNEAYMMEGSCDLAELVRGVEKTLLPQAADKDIAFSADCSGMEHTNVRGDQGKLRQLLMYLTGNAVTYTNPGGKVSLTITEGERRPNDYAAYRIEVADTGIGISEEFLAHIFEPFARERNTTLSGVHGVGLGLTIAKNIVDMMGGTIEARSSVGKGSVFTVTLLLHIQPQEPPVCAGTDESAAQPAGQKILLVEDNEINLEIETEMLKELGFSIGTAVNGKEAVEKVERSAPGEYNLILMDIQMPVMDGWQAARAIRELANPGLARIPIIALSANVFESDIRTSIESGMDAHLTKPIDIPVLLKTMEEVTQARRGQTPRKLV